jgi:TnpA family transposase
MLLVTPHFASQLNRAACLSLLLNIIIAWNTRYM